MNPHRESEDPLDMLLKKGLEGDVPPDVRNRMQGHIERFRTQVRTRDYVWRPRWDAQWLFVRAAAGVCAAAALLIGFGILLGGNTPPTWAEVVERFSEASFLSATVYVKAEADADPVQLELWMTRGGKLRLRAGNQVIFGEKGRVIDSVPLSSAPKPSGTVRSAQLMLQQFIERLGALDTFSFETFVRALPQTGVFSAPLPNENVSISRDLAVFDIANPDSPDWIRIWALRESRLPVRILFWNPDVCKSIDVMLSYTDDQSPEFFDPNAFKAALSHTPPDTFGKAYLLFKDPGGRAMTPEDVRVRQQQTVPDRQS